jgi:hypothetical protein
MPFGETPDQEDRILAENPLLRVAVFGRQVEDFLRTDIGDYLLKQAEYDANEAIRKLKTTSPWRRRRIQELQNDIRVAENFINWLAEAIQSGEQAKQQLEER